MFGELLLRQVSTPLQRPGECNSAAVDSLMINDSEVLFCKNNVCVHRLQSDNDEHTAGYLTLYSKHNEDNNCMLLLTWIPNSILCNSTKTAAPFISSIFERSRFSSPCHSDCPVAGCWSHDENSYLESDEQLRNSRGGIGGLTGPEDVEDTNVEAIKTELDNNYSGMACRMRNTKTSQQTQPFCGIFYVDLICTRALRFLFATDDSTSGQLVIISSESQYKIFHFHYGGLDRLARELEQWDALLQLETTVKSRPYRQFSVKSSESLGDDELHPEEGQYEAVNEELWSSHVGADGKVDEEFYLSKAVYFGGVEPALRRDIWPFLLRYFPFASTWEEREQIRFRQSAHYERISSQRSVLDGDAKETFWKTVECIVDKDVVRTDRSHPFYAGDHNPNLVIMRNILLNYAIYNPDTGYTQGMSDLLAPLLAELRDEVDTFWCFVGLLQHTGFCCSPKDVDMDCHLNNIRELLRLMLPDFYSCLCSQSSNGLPPEMLFCHRWILLCFKREFDEEDVLRCWEACWANFQTEYFHLFICISIVAEYGDDIVDHHLTADETLLHFSDLATHMDGELILRKSTVHATNDWSWGVEDQAQDQTFVARL